MTAPGTAQIEPLHGKRDKHAMRLIVAGSAELHKQIVNALVSDAISLIDHAESEAALFDHIEREEFDCLIADLAVGTRNTLELREIMEKRVTVPPAMIILTEAPNPKVVLKAFRNGVADVVTSGPSCGQELLGAVRRAAARNRKTRNLLDEIEYLSKLARYDRLTGVPNRNFLEDRLSGLVAGARRHDGAFAVLSIDVNNFEAIKDIYGYAIGDQILKAFARQLMQASRSSDAFGRLTGNEFLYLIDREVTTESVEQACVRLSKALAFTVDLDNVGIGVSASIGAALCPVDGAGMDDLLGAARQAKQIAKAAGDGYHVPHTVQITLETVAVGDTGADDTVAAKVDEGEAKPGDRGANRRIEHRERVLRRGRIILGDGFSTIDCIIRDISAHGARFTVQDGIAIPRTLSLAILDTGHTHRAIRRWQRGPSIGVEFAAENQAEAAQDSEKAA